MKKLESIGIGRPSTFATMVSVVQDRGYVVENSTDGTTVEAILYTLENNKITTSKKQEKIGADKKKLFPESSAYVLIDFMSKYFSNIVDYKFTSKLEKQFDKIANGGIGWSDMLQSFYDEFHPGVEKSVIDSCRY